MMVREFQFFDRDGNGQVTLDEYKGPLSGLVAERDRNNDGSLGADDRPADGPRFRQLHGPVGGMMGGGMMGRGMMGEGHGPCGGGGDGPGDQDEAPAGQPGDGQ